MVRSFELCAQAGADMLSIESTGGKEVHDDAILNGDLHLSVFALGVLGGRNMAFLWDMISMWHSGITLSRRAIRPVASRIRP